jgi:hypothetical protein
LKKYDERKKVIEDEKQTKNHDLVRSRYKKALREKQLEQERDALNTESKSKHLHIHERLIEQSKNVRKSKNMRV